MHDVAHETFFRSTKNGSSRKTDRPEATFHGLEHQIHGLELQMRGLELVWSWSRPWTLRKHKGNP